MTTALETLRGLRSGAISIPLPLNDDIDNIDRIAKTSVLNETESLNTELCRLHDYVIRLRCENPPKGTRGQSLAYLEKQTDNLAARSVDSGGTENGWPDPADVFAAGDQITGLREGLAEISRAGASYPIPLPEGCRLLPQSNFDPFEHGRSYNGRVIAEGWIGHNGVTGYELGTEKKGEL